MLRKDYQANMKYLFLLGALFLLVNNVSVAQTGTDDRVYERREVTQPARILSKPEPSFTDEARQNDVDGVVRLRLVLAASGKVTDISVIEGLPYGLTDNALKAANEIKFTPAIKDGRAVSQYMEAE